MSRPAGNGMSKATKKNTGRNVNSTVWLLISCFLSIPALADWNLDSTGSSVSFVSIKNAAAVEAHHFTSISGSVSTSGQIAIKIDLASVETLIPIRNERMIKMLFETTKFPSAAIAAEISPDAFLSMKAGSSRQLNINGKVTLHGKTADLQIPVIVIKLSANSFQVSSHKPVVISAGQFDLGAGIEALREVAGLQSITASVPVSFNLLFVPSGKH